jgi:hypothetical protein
MNERRALILLFAVMLLITGCLFYGLQALHANSSAQFLGFIVPLMLCSYLSSRIVMHYGASERDRR